MSYRKWLGPTDTAEPAEPRRTEPLLVESGIGPTGIAGFVVRRGALHQPWPTIIPRTRKDGTTAYSPEAGRPCHPARGANLRPQASRQGWLARRETELSQPGAFDRQKDIRLNAVIDQYVREAERDIGRTKAQVLANLTAS